MGACCCCFRDDWEDLADINSSIYRNCVCLRCFVENVLHGYSLFFQRTRGSHTTIPSSDQVTTSISATSSLDDSLAETYVSPPRPLPYDVDPRYFRLQQGALLHTTRGKGSSQSNEEIEPLRTSQIDSGSEIFNKKWNKLENEEKHDSKLALKLATAKNMTGFAHIDASSEDEDVCPTCLEEYTTENPKIITKCCHHFHLGCIYEWMERSETCPVCGKVMAFDETT